MGWSFNKNKSSTSYTLSLCYLLGLQEQIRPHPFLKHPELLGDTDKNMWVPGAKAVTSAGVQMGLGHSVSRCGDLSKRDWSSSQGNSHRTEVGARHHELDPLNKASIVKNQEWFEGQLSVWHMFACSPKAQCSNTQPLFMPCGYISEPQGQLEARALKLKGLFPANHVNRLTRCSILNGTGNNRAVPFPTICVVSLGSPS